MSLSATAASDVSSVWGWCRGRKSRGWHAGRKNRLLVLAVVVITAGVLFIFLSSLLNDISERHLPTLKTLSNDVDHVMTLNPTTNGESSQPVSRRPDTIEGAWLPASHYGKSEASGTLMPKTVNASILEAHLSSSRAYLLSFVSPMIREKPGHYSWPEGAKEKEWRKSQPPLVETGRRKKRIVWYNAPHFIPRGTSKALFSRCPVKYCEVSYKRTDVSRADVVVFAGAPSKTVIPRVHPAQVYVFFTMESPERTSSNFSDTPWNSAFNWTWNYRQDSDIFQPVGYLKRSVPSLERVVQVTRRKTKLVSWISSHCGVQSDRDRYVRRLKKVIPVDHYGACGNMKCDGKTPNCSAMLNDYFYYLSLENAMCPDYVTEKYYKTFFRDTYVLAVVRGGANYSRFFPEGTFIDAESFPSPEALGRYLLALMRDEARYVDMLWRKAHFVYHEHGIVDAYCQLCYKAHHAQRFAKTYPDLYAWYYRDQCRPPRKFR